MAKRKKEILSTYPTVNPTVNGAATPEPVADSVPLPLTEEAPPLINPLPNPPAIAGTDFFTVPPAPSSVTRDYDLTAFLDVPGPVETRVDTEIELVRARKPSPTRYVTVHPKKLFGWIIPEDRDIRREPYLVATEIAKLHTSLCRKAQFVAWVDQFGNYSVWPILQENATGDINDYSLSAMKKVDLAIARGGWHAFRTVKEQHGYALFKAPEDFGPAKWPPDGPDLLLNKAFEGRRIGSSDHPILQGLLGIQVP